MASPEDSLFLVLCDERELAANQARAQQAGVEFVTRPIAPGLHEVLIAEQGESLAWVEPRMLGDVGIEGARKLALANLRKRTPLPLRIFKLHPEHNVYAVGDDDGLGSGRFLLHDLFATLRDGLPAEAELLVRVITRGLVVCCANTPGDMQWVDELCLKASAQPGFIGGPWFAWTPVSWGLIAIEAT